MERWQIGDQWKSRYCPRQLITEDTTAWLKLFTSYRAGFLLEAGGLMEQPAIYLEAMQAIQSFVSEATWQEEQNST